MIRRFVSVTALATSVLFLGCAAPTEDEEIVQDTSAAATTDCDPFSDTCDPTVYDTLTPVAFTISGLNSSSLVITGTNAKGQTINARFTTRTMFREARLWRYTPADPIYPAVVAYNDALAAGSLNSDSGIYTAVSGLIGDTARVWVNKRNNTVRAFRPVPSF